MDWVYPIITILSTEIKRIVSMILEQSLLIISACLYLFYLGSLKTSRSVDLSMNYTTLERQSISELEQYLHLSTS